MSDWTATTADGVAIAVHDLGGTGAAAVFAHATGFPLLTYRPLLEMLATELHCFGPDLRGVGGSGWPDDDSASWRGFVEDLSATLSITGNLPRQGVEGDAHNALLGIGHSSGATALLLLEATRPGTFTGLYCFEPAYFPPGENAPDQAAAERAARLAEGARRRRERFATRQEARARLSASPIGVLTPASLESYLDHAFVAEADGSLQLVLSPDREARIYEAALEAGALLDPSAVTCPVQLAAGTASDPVSRSGAEALAAALPRALLDEVGQLGHLAPLESPAVFAGYVLDWARSPTRLHQRDTPVT